MGGGEERIKNREVAALLAGLEAGVLATLALLGWLALAAAGNRRSIWSAANLMATTFYGDLLLTEISAYEHYPAWLFT